MHQGKRSVRDALRLSDPNGVFAIPPFPPGRGCLPRKRQAAPFGA